MRGRERERNRKGEGREQGGEGIGREERERIPWIPVVVASFWSFLSGGVLSSS